jgi:hypothetical protein
MGLCWKFFAGLGLGFLLAVALNLAAFSFVLGVPTENSRWTFEITRKKQMLADTSMPPRLLIVGGSASLFGLSARELERVTGQRTINLSTHAAVGTAYMLDNAKKAARTGDTVLLVLEYELYVSKGRDSLWLDYVVARDPQYFHHLSLAEQWNIFMLTPSQRLVRGLENRFNPRAYTKHVVQSGPYTADQINSWGDQSYHPRSAAPANFEHRPTMLASPLPDHPVGFPQIASFCAWAREHQIRVLATFPNVLDQPLLRAPLANKNATRIENFYKQLGVPVVGDYTDALLPLDQFFDTVYHLTDEAAVARTQRLIEKLKPFLRPAETNRTSTSQ